MKITNILAFIVNLIANLVILPWTVQVVREQFTMPNPGTELGLGILIPLIIGTICAVVMIIPVTVALISLFKRYRETVFCRLNQIFILVFVLQVGAFFLLIQI